jgi:hypothetical protein
MRDDDGTGRPDARIGFWSPEMRPAVPAADHLPLTFGPDGRR